MKPTLPWDLPVPAQISERIQKYCTVFKKKIEVLENKTEYVKLNHYWGSGVTGVCYEKWNNFDDEVNKIIYKHRYDKYDGEKFVERSVDSLRKDPQINEIVFVKVGEIRRFTFIDAIDGMIVIRFFSFIGHIPKINEKGEFKEFKRVFIKDEVVWTESREKSGEKFIWEEKNIKKGLCAIVDRYKKPMVLVNNDVDVTEILMKNIKGALFFGDVTHATDVMFDFLPTLPKKNKFQDKIDELTLLHSKIKVRINEPVLFKNYMGRMSIVSHKLAHFQRIDENSAVIRLYYIYHDNIVEYARIYADKDKIYPCYYKNGIVSRCDKEDIKFWSLSVKMQPVNVKGTAFEKYFPAMSEREFDTYELFMIQRYCYLEQLSKLGFYKLCETIVGDNQTKYIIKRRQELSCKPKTQITLKDLFSKTEIKYLLIFKDRITDYENMEKISEFAKASEIKDKNLISYICQITKGKPVSNYSFYHLGRTLRYINNCDLGKEKNTIIKSAIRQFGRAMDLTTYYPYSELRDTYEMYIKVYDDKVVLIRELKKLAKITSVEDVHKYHDEIVPLVRIKDGSEERFEKSVQKSKKYEYENDDYRIMLPKTTTDVVTEGKRMNHCVGGYIDNIINGYSVILFLRKKENINHEYITMEINENGELVQVKCKNNQYIKTEKTLNFLTEWVKTKKIKLKTHDVSVKKGVLCPAPTSYCGYLEE